MLQRSEKISNPPPTSGWPDIAYLDNAATTQKPKQVIDTLVNYYTNYNANIHRGIYRISEEATAAHEEARAKIAPIPSTPGAPKR